MGGEGQRMGEGEGRGGKWRGGQGAMPPHVPPHTFQKYPFWPPHFLPVKNVCIRS